MYFEKSILVSVARCGTVCLDRDGAEIDRCSFLSLEFVGTWLMKTEEFRGYGLREMVKCSLASE